MGQCSWQLYSEMTRLNVLENLQSLIVDFDAAVMFFNVLIATSFGT